MNNVDVILLLVTNLPEIYCRSLQGVYVADGCQNSSVVKGRIAFIADNEGKEGCSYFNQVCD